MNPQTPHLSPGLKAGIIAAISAVSAFFAEVRGLVPATVERMVWAVILLGVGDFITGVVAAGYERNLSSGEMRQRTVVKLAQFLGLVCLGAAASILTGTWTFYGGAWGAVGMIEVLSITENLARLEVAGANLGPARPFLRSIARFFAGFASLPGEDGGEGCGGKRKDARESQEGARGRQKGERVGEK